MEIMRYTDYSKSLELADEFLLIIGSDMVSESSSVSYKSVLKKVIKDLKLNASISLTFGASLTAMFPIVEKLVTNMNLKIDLNPETVVLMTVSGFTIAYLEENKDINDKKVFEKDAKSELEELKLRGVGNGVIKKIVKCIKSIGNIFNILFKHKRTLTNKFFDMFAYAAITIPVLNAISYMIGKYHMDIESLPSNFLSLGLGVTTIAAKHGLNYLVDKLKDQLKLNKKNILKGINDVNDPTFQKYPHPAEFVDVEIVDDKKSKLIKEQ